MGDPEEDDLNNSSSDFVTAPQQEAAGDQVESWAVSTSGGSESMASLSLEDDDKKEGFLPEHKSQSWVCESQLGSGGFGVVHVWKNVTSNQRIALKKCKYGSEMTMTAKHKAQWCQEVDIMLRLDHVNVVACYPTPQGLDPGTSELPSLCMEFCEAGDLRRVLNHVENCRGLAESDVLNLLKDVSRAIEYLHNRRIIHRDLKPENVVMKSGERIVYKLIDLGYAKELGASSLAQSFVGTLQYVAPELFLGKDYTKSVDYWSLGLLAHEVVTGQRPFLPHLSPGQWVDHVEQKGREHLAVVEDISGDIRYENRLAKECLISRNLASSLEPWLRSLLDWNPVQRGRDSKGSVLVFGQLSKILSEKRVAVFNLMSCQLVHIKLTHQPTFSSLQKQLSQETGLSEKDIIVLTHHGYCVTNEDDILQFVDGEYPLMTFALPDRQQQQSQEQLTPAHQLKFIQLAIPALVQTAISKPNVDVADYHLKLMYIHGHHLIAQEKRNLSLFHHGLKAFHCHLQVCASSQKNPDGLSSKLACAKGKVELFLYSLMQDLNSYHNQASRRDRVTSQKMINSWRQAEKEIKELMEVVDQSYLNIRDCLKVTEQGLEQTKSSELLLTSEMVDSVIKDLEKRSLSLYQCVRSERPAKRKDNSPRPIALLVVKMLKRRDEILRANCNLFCQLRQLLKQLGDIEQAVTAWLEDVAKLEQKINKAQARRQSDVWTLLAAAVKYPPAASHQSSTSPYSNEKSARHHSSQQHIDTRESIQRQSPMSSRSQSHSASNPRHGASASPQQTRSDAAPTRPSTADASLLPCTRDVDDVNVASLPSPCAGQPLHSWDTETGSHRRHPPAGLGDRGRAVSLDWPQAGGMSPSSTPGTRRLSDGTSGSPSSKSSSIHDKEASFNPLDMGSRLGRLEESVAKIYNNLD